MKIKKRFLSFFVLLFALLCVVGAGKAQAATTAYLNETSMAITVGKSINLKIRSVNSAKAKWKSSKSSVAKVNSKGKVTGKKAGTATITATYQGVKYKCKVTVEPKKYTYNKVVYKDSYVKIKLKYTTKDNIYLSITNRTNSMMDFDCDYIKLDSKEYADCPWAMTIGAKDTREYKVLDDGAAVSNPKCKKISGVFNVFVDSEWVEYVNLTNAAVK